MRKLVLILSLIVFVFSCKKAEVREKIEGIWEIERIERGWNSPYGYSGTIEFESCTGKMNRKEECLANFYVIRHEKVTNNFDTSNYVRNYKIEKRAIELLVNAMGEYQLLRGRYSLCDPINEKLILYQPGGPKSYQKIYLTRK